MKRLVIMFAVLNLLVIILASCATAPPMSYSYTQKGIRLTSEPSGANVTITATSMAQGKSASTSLNYITPFYNPEDRFVTYAESGGMEIEMQYYINVSKPGYKTITINVNGSDMKSVWHWNLEPIGQGPTSGNLDEAYALNDECRLYHDKKEYNAAIDRCTRALAIAEKYLEHDSMEIEKFYRMLGLVYVARGVYSMDSDRLNVDSETAKYYLKKALSIRENQLGPNDPQTVDLRNFMVEIFGTDFFKR